MSETVKVPHCLAWPQTHLGDSGPWLSDGSHLIAHGDERHSRRLRKRSAKENKRFCRGQASCRDDVDGFPLSSTKPSTVYHEFHVFDSDVPPLHPPSHLLDSPNNCAVCFYWGWDRGWCHSLTKWHSVGGQVQTPSSVSGYQSGASGFLLIFKCQRHSASSLKHADSAAFDQSLCSLKAMDQSWLLL